MQILTEHPPTFGQQGQLALAAAPDDTADLDEIAEVDGARQVQGVGFESTGVDEDLHVATPVADVAEDHLAEVAHPDHPTGDPVRGAFGRGKGLGDGVGRRKRGGIRVDPGGGRLVEFGQSHPDLLGSPRSAVFGPFRAGDLGRNGIDVDTRGDRRRVAGEVACLATELRQLHETFVDHGGQADAGNGPAVLETEEAGGPTGVGTWRWTCRATPSARTWTRTSARRTWFA